MTILEIVTWFGITGVGAAAAAFGLFRFLGSKWLDSRFAERLERFKHSQNQEIERLRFRINALMDRTTKLHQHEFEALPQVWEKLGLALAWAQSFTSRGQQYPDLEQLSDAALAEFLAKSELREYEKRELDERRGRNQRYMRIIFWHKLNRTREIYADFHNYFVAKGIFIEVELKKKIDAIDTMIYEAIDEREFEERYPDPNPERARFAKCDRLQREGKVEFDKLEKDVQARLWEANKLD